MAQEKKDTTLAKVPPTFPLPLHIWAFQITPMLSFQSRGSCQFFRQASNVKYCADLKNTLAIERPEIDLQSLLRVINNLNNPRKVLNQLIWLSRLHISNLTTKALLHDICYEPNNPILWLLLDDNVSEFFKRVTISHEQIEFLPAALALNSAAIVETLLLKHSAQIAADMKLLAVRATLFSGNMKMIERLKQYNFKPVYKDFELLFAIGSRREAMVAMVLKNSTPELLDLLNVDGIWDEGIWNAAAKSGVIQIMSHLFDYAKQNNKSFSLLPSTQYLSLESGNPAMVDYVETKKGAVYVKSLYHYMGFGDMAKSMALSSGILMYDKFRSDLAGLSEPVIVVPSDMLLAAAWAGNKLMFEKVLKDYPQIQLSQLVLNNLLVAAASSGSLVMWRCINALMVARQCSVFFDVNLLNAAARGSIAVFNTVLDLAANAEISLAPTLDTLRAAVESGQPQLVNAVLQLAHSFNISLPVDQEMLVCALFVGNKSMIIVLVDEARKQKVTIDYTSLKATAVRTYNPSSVGVLEQLMIQTIEKDDTELCEELCLRP